MTITITATDPTPAEALGLAAFAGAFTLAGAGSVAGGTATPTVTGGGTPAGSATVAGGAGASTIAAAAPAAPAATNFFPANPGLAPFPSPDNSDIIVVGGVPTGAPYLRDATGAIFTLAVVNGVGVPSVNGNVINTAGSGPNITQMLMRGNAVWVEVGTGQWQTFNAAMGCFYNGTLPPPGSASPSSTSAPAAPAAPTPSAIAPGSTGVVHTVAATGAQFSTISAAIAAAAAGDTISVAPGTYKETPPAITKPLRISSVSPGATIDAGGMTATLARGKGALVPAADAIFDWMYGVNVALDQTASGMTSAIRPDAGCGYLTLNSCGASACQTGLGAGGFACVIVDNKGTYSDCGLPDGLSHDIYVGQGIDSLTLNGTVVTKPRFAHAVKSRALAFSWTGGEVDAANGSPIDLPDGTSSVAVISGVIVNKGTADANFNLFSVNEESATNGTAGAILDGCTINADCNNPFVQTGAGTVTFLPTCKFTGNPITTQASGGGKVVGLPAIPAAA